MALTATELDLKKNQKRLDASVMALEALRNVIKNNSGISCACVTMTCHMYTHTFSSPEAAILLVSTKNRDLWLVPIFEHAQKSLSPA